MNILKKAVTWLWLLCKRLYKKPVFLVLLALIPLLTWGYSRIAGQDSGMLTVLLAQEGSDPLTDRIFAQLQEDTQLVRFIVCDSPPQAHQLLARGKADAAWIFPEELAAHLDTFAARPTKDNAFITVLEREDNVALMLSREKLSGALYPAVAQRVYLQYLRQKAPELTALSDAALLAYFDGASLSDQLFIFASADGQAASPSPHYLLTPLRGLLAVIGLLCAMACAMYHIRDLETGTFAWVRHPWRVVPELAGQLVCVGHVNAVSLLCLSLCGLSGSLLTELASLVLYSLCAGLFAMTLRRLCGCVQVLGALLPLVSVAALVLCPVFFDLGSLRQLQLLLPPTYYIHAAGDPMYLLYMLLYTGVLAVIYRLLGVLLRRE